MRILYMHRGYFPLLAGADAMLWRIAGLMRDRGHQVQVVCRSSDNSISQRWVDGIAVLAVPTPDVPALQTLLATRADIVHAVDAVWPEYLQAAQGLATAWAVPLVVTPASISSTWHSQTAVFTVCRSAAAVFVLTGAEQATFAQQGVGLDRIWRIGQGPELAGQPSPAAWRARYGVVGPLVLFVGRKVRFKGYHVLLDAAEIVWENHVDTTFAFIGPHWDADCTKVFAQHTDRRVIDCGMVDAQDKYSALTACDMLCLPTTDDVFPLVFVEAWACGKPVISGPFPGADEVVRHNHDGLIVDATPSALAAAVNFMLCHHELCITMGAAGRARVNTELNWHAVTDTILEAYQKVTMPHQF